MKRGVVQPGRTPALGAGDLGSNPSSATSPADEVHNLVIDRIALSINPMLLALALEVFKDAKPSTPEERAILKKIVGHVTSARSSAGLIFCRCRKGSWVECCCRVDRGSHCTCCAVAQERNQPPGAACFCSSETKDEPPA